MFRAVRVGRGMSGGPGVTVKDIIKQEVGEVVDTHEKKDDVSGDEYSGIIAEDYDGVPHDDGKAVPREDVQMSRPSLTKISLLNKPPRLGLSKLYRSSTSLLDVTIVDAEDVKVRNQQEVFIIEKEE